MQYVVLFALLALVLARLWKQAGWRPAVWFALSQLAVSVFFVPRQVQFFTTFFLAYAGCAWVLDRRFGPRTPSDLAVGLVVLGTATAFCDLLVTPISHWACRWRSGWYACHSVCAPVCVSVRR